MLCGKRQRTRNIKNIKNIKKPSWQSGLMLPLALDSNPVEFGHIGPRIQREREREREGERGRQREFIREQCP